jgi:lipopolysaccharide export LptBFGC system permease protein LptF
VRVIRTDRVRIDSDGIWEIEDATIWSFDPADPERPPRLQERVSMTLDLETLGGDALLGADPGLLPLPILARYLEHTPREETSSNLRRLTRRYHERLSSPWLVLVFAWLALPFALRVGPAGGIARPAAEGIALLGAFFVLRSAGETLAQEELFPTGVTPWLVLGLFSLGAAWLLRRRAI